MTEKDKKKDGLHRRKDHLRQSNKVVNSADQAVSSDEKKKTSVRKARNGMKKLLNRGRIKRPVKSIKTIKKNGKPVVKKPKNIFKRTADKLASQKEKTIVIALGGNALIKKGQRGTIEEQLQNLDHALEQIAKLARHGYRLVITHGNGPQVGNILMQQEHASGRVPKMPLYACVAQSQGLIGYMIQEVLYNKLHSIGVDIPVVTMVTQVLVDRNDSGFKRPTKPIGPYYRNGTHLPAHWHIIETLRGARRVVASPKPRGIVETEAIRDLLGKAIVIACGGGGIPVVKDKLHITDKKVKPGLFGVDAVIDKDLATARLARSIRADMMIILTNVDSVYVNWDKSKGKKRIERMNIEKAKQLQGENHFAAGSMAPKIEASLNFLGSGGRKVLITDLDGLADALRGKTGTIIEP